MNAVMHKLESCSPWTEEWITYSFYSTTNKVEIHEETSIVSNRLQFLLYNTLQSNKDFRAPLTWVNKMMPQFLTIGPFLY